MEVPPGARLPRSAMPHKPSSAVFSTKGSTPGRREPAAGHARRRQLPRPHRRPTPVLDRHRLSRDTNENLGPEDTEQPKMSVTPCPASHGHDRHVTLDPTVKPRSKDQEARSLLQ
jgi:hypothetical protein